MKKVIRLTESDLARIVKRVINETKFAKSIIIEGEYKDAVLDLIEKSKVDPKCKKCPECTYCGVPGKIIFDYIEIQGMSGIGTNEEKVMGGIYAVGDKKTYQELKDMVKKKYPQKDFWGWIHDEMPYLPPFPPRTGDQGSSQWEESLPYEFGKNNHYLKEIGRHLGQFEKPF